MATAELVLSRFPRHLDADGPGKVIGDVVTALAIAAETQVVQVGQVRRSRRLGELDQVGDLIRLAALHGGGRPLLEALARRVRGTDPPAPYDVWLDVARAMVRDLVVLQREESGTVAGLLGATAAYLGFAVDEVTHDAGGYWHLARCRDRLVPPGAPALVALEENPPRLADLGPSPFAHAARFSVLRQGFDPVPASVIVKGIDDRTLRPMVVNVDEGVGVVATFAVPGGSTLRFERDGRVELDGSSLARSCFTFRGAVFADARRDHPKDFVFHDAEAPGPSGPSGGDRRGVFAVTQPPPDAFDPNPSIPHGDGLLPAVVLDRRETRFAVFVGAGAFASDRGAAGVVDAAPQQVAGYFDRTVFDPDPTGTPSLEVGFEWDEREAYAVKVWLPFHLQRLDDEHEVPVREVVRGLLDRHRAAGVHVYVEHADPRWTLGTGVVRDIESDDALGVVVAGTEAWADDAEQPGGGA